MIFTGANRLIGVEAGRFDGHTHVFRADLPMIADRRYTPDHDAEMDDLILLLREHALDGAILVQPSFLGFDNRFLLSALSVAEGTDDLTLRGVVMLDPAASPMEIADLAAQGVIGMRLNLVGGTARDFDVAVWDRVLRRIDAVGWHVELHCEGPLLRPILDALLIRCRTVVVDHFGLPDATASDDGLFRALPSDRVMVKVSAPYRVFPNASSREAATLCLPIVERIARELGSHNLIWGSDWPWTRFEGRHSYSDTLDWLNQSEQAPRAAQSGP